jgi:hypothetical protein
MCAKLPLSSRISSGRPGPITAAIAPKAPLTSRTPASETVHVPPFCDVFFRKAYGLPWRAMVEDREGGVKPPLGLDHGAAADVEERLDPPIGDRVRQPPPDGVPPDGRPAGLASAGPALKERGRPAAGRDAEGDVQFEGRGRRRHDGGVLKGVERPVARVRILGRQRREPTPPFGSG